MTKTTKVTLKTKLKNEDEFVPPDGGWGWMIVVAAGLSNLSMLPILQQFGLLFRDKFQTLGITSSETTTIINTHSAFASCVGLLNGPVFRTFTYRQVSLVGSSIVFIALLMTTFSYNFATYLVSFSILYGSGYGISSSANALALNTYWKKRRRIATGLSWTATGLGPIIWPQIITILFVIYGETGATFIIAGFAIHAIACALLLHPVEWHARSLDSEKDKFIKSGTNSNIKRQYSEETKESHYFTSLNKIKNLSAFSSQYLYNEDDPINTGYEITDPGIPMMIKSNDGYFSQSRQSRSRLSSKNGSNNNSRLNSAKPSTNNLQENRSRKSSTLYLNESKKSSFVDVGSVINERDSKNEQPRSKSKRRTSITLETLIPESEIEDCPTLKAPQDLKAEEKKVIENIDPEKIKSIADRADKHFVSSKSTKSFKMDGQYSEKYNKDNHSNVSLTKQGEDSEEKKYLADNHSNQSYRTNRQRRKSNHFNYESEVLKQASLKLEEYLQHKTEKVNIEKLKLLVTGDLSDEDNDDVFEKQTVEDDNLKDEEQITFCQKIAIFFDLDLLKDFTFVNLMLGITLASFNEMNFSILTPFILGDFGFSRPQVALFMSLLAGVDISVRFCVPFVAGKIGWDNNSFFLLGVLSMAAGRVVLASYQSFGVILVVAVIIGFGKGLRTVFMALVIPTYVPLYKLPGASGLQLMTAGIVYLSLGPVVGWIKDAAPPFVTLHCLNIFTWLTAISWGLEKFYRSKRSTSTEDIIA